MRVLSIESFTSISKRKVKLGDKSDVEILFNFSIKLISIPPPYPWYAIDESVYLSVITTFPFSRLGFITLLTSSDLEVWNNNNSVIISISVFSLIIFLIFSEKFVLPGSLTIIELIFAFSRPSFSNFD